MSRWTHSICEDCYYKLREERDWAKLPSRLREPEPENCCYCGHQHQSGIYVRDDPNLVACKGEHE
jgi:hypothetical protein